MRFILNSLFGFGLVVGFALPVHARGLCDGAPDEYVMEAIQGKVVDAETETPIEGAVVVAFWETIQPMQFLKIEESVTDLNGAFSFSGWGPIKRPRPGCFYDMDPYLKIFKAGFYPKGAANTYYLDPDHPGSAYETMTNPFSSKLRKSRYNGRTIKLRKFVLGTEEDVTDPITGRIIKRSVTEKDWCQQIDFTLDQFSSADITFPKINFSVPELRKVMYEQRRLHPECFNRGADSLYLLGK